MVMATYSPQRVGLEFVRQYYTVLHKDPKQLHRFYTKQSLFTHGRSQGSRSDEPIIGQEAIHNKICQLKFRECYSKIISVDSHPTIGDGVVVQVTGELSNDGLPMRRFMQTFVLAQQAPKKYCVFNDIFRYQDDEFDDENEVNEESPESDTEVMPSQEPIAPPVNEALQSIVPPDPATDYYHASAEFTELEPPKGMVNGELSDSEDQPEDFSDSQSAQLEEVVVKPAFEPQEEQGSADECLGDNYQEHENATVPPPVETIEKQEEEYLEEEPKLIETSERNEEEAEIVEEPSKPVTWAAMAKKNAHPSPSQPALVTRAPPKPQPQPVAVSAPLPQRGPQRRREDSKSEKTEGRRKFTGPPPDSNQIFIGNLPNGISEGDVRNIFKEFGNVTEVRINPKNFGFVAFDSAEPVCEILNRPSSKPIMFNSKIINIEEKRSGGPPGGPRGGPKRDKEGAGRSKGDGYQRGGGPGGRGGPPGGRGGKGGGGGAGGGGSGGGSGFQRQKSGSEGSKGENNRGGRYRDRAGGAPRR